MLRTGGVVALVVVVALAGCAGLAGLDDETSTPGPTPEPTPESTPTVTPTPTPEPTPEPTPTPEWDESLVAPGVENPEGSLLKTFANNKTQTLLSGAVTVYDENGAEQQSFTLDGKWQHQIDDLEPGIEYTVVVEPDWSTHEMPTVETSFDPGQTDEVEMFTLPDFQKTEQFEWDWRFIQGAYVDDDTLEFINQEDFVDRDRQLIGGGIYDNGDWVAMWNELWVVEDPDRNATAGLSIDGDLYTRNFHKNWRENDEVALNPTYQPEFAPIRDGVFNIDNISLEYLETRELNDSTVPEALHIRSIPEQTEGKEVHVFNITLWGYSDRTGGPYVFGPNNHARIYVDAETGHVLRWEARERLSIGLGFYDYYVGMNPSIHVIDFYNHDDEEIEVDADDYPPAQ